MSETTASRIFGLPQTERPMAEAMNRRLNDALAAEEHAGHRLAVKGRVMSLAAIAALLCFLTPFPSVLYFHGLLALFALLGLADLWWSGNPRHRPWHGYAFIALDFALLAFTLLHPNPLSDFEIPPQVRYRFGSFIYFFVLLCGLAFSYRPRAMLLGGLFGAVFWSLAAWWVVAMPDTVTELPDEGTYQGLIDAITNPMHVDVGVRVQEVVVFLIVAGLLALVVTRSRRLVLRQAAFERERGNLARHFPPSMVDRLARMDAPLSQVREQQVAVLFADVVGFTRWAEGRAPTEVIAFLRQVHARLERAVFDHGGTLDKFIGDGVMATFGTPETGERDAGNALGCLRAILAAFEDWNVERRAAGEAPVAISVGLHYGPVVIGDIGSERRLEFAVLGDTVNVASRLERLTREHACRAAISDAVIAAARAEAPDGPILDGLSQSAEQAIRGRAEAVRVWTL